MKRMFWMMALAIISLSLVFSCSRPQDNLPDPEQFPPDVLVSWHKTALEAVGGPANPHPMNASRVFAMVHLAMHDAVNAISPKYETYRFAGSDSSASPIAAAAAAAHAVLLHELPEKKGFLDSALATSLATIPASESRERGLLLGEAAAMAMIEARSNDGSKGEPMMKVPLSDVPGVYQGVPPFNIVFAPHWQDVRLFGLQRQDQFRPSPYPPLTSSEYAEDFEEVKKTGELNSHTRTAEQSAYAKFWYEFSEVGWSRIACTVMMDRKMNLQDGARFMALVTMAMADSYIAGWNAKLFYNFWRPYTAIRMAANDNNPMTEPDPIWEPSEPTPPVQDYPSTHSVLGNAAASVMARILGDELSFTASSSTSQPAGNTRHFTSFSQAANENADSRVRAGIHFRFSCQAGQDMGNKIGDWMVTHFLRKKI